MVPQTAVNVSIQFEVLRCGIWCPVMRNSMPDIYRYEAPASLMFHLGGWLFTEMVIKVLPLFD